MLLVLTLLVVVGSLAAPAVTNSFSSVRLRRAGDKLLTCWAQTRARAIETGLPQQFRFEPDASGYSVEPWTPAAAQAQVGYTPATAGAPMANAATPATVASDPTASDGSLSPSSADDSDAPVRNYSLPDQITFHSGDARMTDPLTHERRVDALTAAQGSQSTPILFFPDGSTSQASLVLANDRDQYLRLTLRGLTGVARASNVLSLSELDRARGTR